MLHQSDLGVPLEGVHLQTSQKGEALPGNPREMKQGKAGRAWRVWLVILWVASSHTSLRELRDLSSGTSEFPQNEGTVAFIYLWIQL